MRFTRLKRGNRDGAGSANRGANIFLIFTSISSRKQLILPFNRYVCHDRVKHHSCCLGNGAIEA